MNLEAGKCDQKLKTVYHLIMSAMGGKQLVIGNSRRVCLKIRDFLRKFYNLPCEVLSADTPSDDNKRIVTDFCGNGLPVLITTQAVAANIPLPEIKQVICECIFVCVCVCILCLYYCIASL